jgi:serine protease Do
MSRLAYIISACLACIAAAAPPTPPPDDELNETFRQAARKAAPCVVTIETVGGTQPTSAARPGPAFIVADGPTTGLIWSADGLILTSSFNFVRDPSVITVVLADGRRFVAELLARDEIRRLAMLKIDAADLPVPKWADLSATKVGQWAISLGRGHGKPASQVSQATGGCTLTAGIISGLKRMSGLVIQTDAKLSPANFGGPLIDIEGRVLGLCVPIGMDPGQLSGVEWYDSGIGFAVPREQADISARDLAQGHNVRRGLLGVGLAHFIPNMVLVGGCGDPSPALRAGIQPGDQIIGIDDEPVKTYADLKRILRPRAAGTEVTVHVRRMADKLAVPLTLAVPEDIGPIQAPSTSSQPETTPATMPADSTPALIPPSSGPS